mgnify:CR=1 FL=1
MKKRSLLFSCMFLCMVGCTSVPEEIVKEVTPTVTTNQVEVIKTSINTQKEETTKNETIARKGLCEVNEPKEVAFADLYNEMNRIGEKNVFCVDEATGVVYFVNFNEDWYIYRIKEGEAKLAVSLPASHLYTYEGSLYFIIDFYGDYTGKEVVSPYIYKDAGIQQGDIYRYTPATGVVEFVYRPGEYVKGADTTRNFIIEDDTIYFSYSIPVEKEWYHREIKFEYLPFGKNKSITDSSERVQKSWNDYWLSSTDGENACLIHKEDYYNQIVLSENVAQSCLVGDEFYYTEGRGYDNSKIYIKNLATEQVEVIDLWETIKEIFPDVAEESLQGQPVITSFVATEQGNKIWASVCKEALICFDRTTKEIIPYQSIWARIGRLYTDGTYLYAQALKDIREDSVSNAGFFCTLSRIYTEQDIVDEKVLSTWNKKMFFVESLTK